MIECEFKRAGRNPQKKKIKKAFPTAVQHFFFRRELLLLCMSKVQGMFEFLSSAERLFEFIILYKFSDSPFLLLSCVECNCWPW